MAVRGENQAGTGDLESPHQELGGRGQQGHSGIDLFSLKAGNAGDVIQFVSKDLGTRGASDVNSSLRAGEVEVKCPSSYSEKRTQT